MKYRNRTGWRIILMPFSWIYGSVVLLRNMMYDSGLLPAVDFNLPVISVGNITVGGTGKTPHIEYLIEMLKEDFHIAVLSRGYRRKTRDFRIAAMDSPVEEIGDEPRQIKHRYPEITVAVDRNRVRGVERLLRSDPALDLILLDDAFQHRSIHPGFSILLIDFNRPLNRDYLLPAGRLREPAGNRNRADMILVTKSPERIKPFEMRQRAREMNLNLRQHLFFTTIHYKELHPVFELSDVHDSSHFRNKKAAILMVTGIADPRPLKRFARSISPKTDEITFPDHHYFSERDLDRIHARFLEMRKDFREVLILTTEKDAMRLQGLEIPDEVKQSLYSVRIRIHFLNEDGKNFEHQIRNYVNSNKRNSILYKK